MLVDAAALPTASATIGSVAEAFVVHELAIFTSSSLSPRLTPFEPYFLTARSVNPAAVSASWWDAATSASGMPLLNRLAALDPGSLSRVLSADPTITQRLLTAPPAVHDVTGWWRLLSPEVREQFVDAAPQLVGSLDGVPFDVRDAANRAHLDAAIAEASSTPVAGRADARTSEQRLHMLEEIRAALEPADSGESRALLSFDPAGAGTAAVAIGDVSTADHISFMVPGMFFTVDGQIVDWTDSTQVLHDEQVRLAGGDAAAASIASISWMGYTTPGLFEVGSLSLAQAGRDALAHTLEGLHELRTGDEPRVTLVAHSYGSTAAMMTLTEFKVSVDAFVLVGSPGGPVASASELHVTPGQVYVGEAAWDPVPPSGFFGVKPGSPEFGARIFGVDGEPGLAASTGHNGYFDRGSESVRNLALIALGRGSDVT